VGGGGHIDGLQLDDDSEGRVDWDFGERSFDGKDGLSK
jgi:hypothetical protein